MRNLSFRFFAISICAFMAIVIMVVIVYMQFLFNKNLTKKAANAEFNILSSSFNHTLNKHNDIYSGYVDIFASFLEGIKLEDMFENKKRYMRIYADFLNKHENINAIYGGTKDDDFFSMRRAIKKEDKASKGYISKDTDVWISRKIQNGKETRRYYDKDFNVTRSIVIENVSYKPTQRPWYKDAVKANNKVIRTDPYKFIFSKIRPTGEVGITYSKEHSDGYVFGMDLLLTKTNKMLKSATNLKSQVSFLLDANYKTILGTDFNKENIKNEIIKMAKTGSKKGIKKIYGVDYIYQVNSFQRDYLITFANFDVLMEPYEQELKKNLIFGIIIVLLLCLMIWYLSSLIAKPILLLCHESKKIASQRFEDVKKVHSKIAEISELSGAIMASAKSIKDYQDKLKRLSSTDALTKIYNRGKIDTELRLIISESKRHECEFGMIIADIDYFKMVNDTFGHQVGDEVLIEFVNVLKSSIREHDIIGRWGGEEFVIICKKINMENLRKLAEKLRINIQDHKFAKIGQKTASFGVSIYKKNDTVETLVKRADDALYRAKNNGRNRVEF